MSQHRIAIIGVGAIATMHARAIGDIEGAELVAGVCRTEEKGRKFASEFGGDWYGDYNTMLDEAKPDTVAIATPSGAHLAPVEACAQRGVHVICEKPLEISTDRVDAMIAAAERGGIMLAGIFPQRFNPVVKAVHAAAMAGRFGPLATISSYVPWWRDDAYYGPDRWQGTLAMDGGGALMNQSIHGVDMLLWIAAAAGADGGDPVANPVAQVAAFSAKRGHDETLLEVEDTAVAVLRFRDGSLGQILGATSMYPGTLKRFQVGGRDGTAEILEDELTQFSFREAHDDDDALRQRFAAKTTTGGGAADPMAIDYANHTRNIAEALDAIDAGRPPALDGREARKAVAVIEAMYRSAAEVRVVDVA